MRPMVVVATQFVNTRFAHGMADARCAWLSSGCAPVPLALALLPAKPTCCGGLGGLLTRIHPDEHDRALHPSGFALLGGG
jgi:hypothetical protein